MAFELPIYIHGVTGRNEGSHHEQYKSFHQAITSYRQDWPAPYCGVEWGWYPGTVLNPKSQQLLTQAERRLGDRALSAVQDPHDFTFNLLRIAVEKFRPLMMYNFSDIFYYVSEDGKAAVRYTVAEQIVNCLKPLIGETKAPISLTFIGHSAGSLIAFDFLFYLFTERPLEEFIKPEKLAQVVPNNSDHKQTLTALEELKKLAMDGQLRVRRLFTFGSPITPLAFRSDKVVEIIAQVGEGRLNAADYGLLTNPSAFGPVLKNPRWINLWDKDDVIGWPVEPLMTDTGTAIVDRYVDVSDDPTQAHTAYWNDQGVHQEIATGR